MARKQLIIGQNIDQSILIQDRGNAIDTMNGARLQNVKQCFTLINKTGEGLRMGYGYGGVCNPVSVNETAVQDIIDDQCHEGLSSDLELAD